MKGETIAATIIYIFCILLALVIALVMITLIWFLWAWVMPQLWSTGPINFIQPNYWLFVGAWILFVTVIRVVRGK